MRLQTAFIASLTSLALSLPAAALASGNVAPEDDAQEHDDELILHDDEPETDENGLTEEQRMDMARALYAEGKAAAEAGDWKEAEAKYEEAYELVPSKHGFAHKVGMAAYRAGDCDKTVEFLVHFIHYTDHEKHADQVEESRGVLAEMLASGCTDEKAIHSYHLSNEVREGMARELYSKAESLAAENKWKQAEALYEEAYYLVPQKIGFSHKVGIAAYRAWSEGQEQEDCDKAHEYLVHFVDFGEDEKYAAKREEALGLITELEETCVSQEELEVHHLAAPDEAHDDDDPFADDRVATDPGKGKAKKKGNKGLLISGAVLTVLGAGGLGVGAAGFVLADQSVDQLNELATLDTPTGFPVGHYDVAEVHEQRLDKRRLMGYVGVAAGGALFVTGIALITVHAVKNKKSSSRARLEGVAPMFTRTSVGAAASLSF